MEQSTKHKLLTEPLFVHSTSYTQMNLKLYFYCSENYKEARSCLTCAENNGCQSADIFRSNLRDATAELCPHIQEFICPADD